MELTVERSETIRRRWTFWLVFAFILISWASIKMVLPALPKLPAELKTGSAGIKLSVSLFLIFFACSQPIWGGFIQGWGVRRTLWGSLLVTALGTTTVIFADNLHLYIVGRSLEGLGMGAASPLSRTVLAGVFERRELVGKIGLLSSSAAAMPALAPILGGFLMAWLGWRALFCFFLLVLVLFAGAAFRRFPETCPGDASPGFPLRLVRTYLSILKTPVFWGFTLSYGSLTGGLIGYYSAMPFWYHVQMKIPVHLFSFLALPTVGLYIAGLVSTRFLIRKKELEEVFRRGMFLALGAAALGGVLKCLEVSGTAWIVVLMSAYGFGAGLVSPTANASLLARFKPVAGPASALVAVVLFGIASLTSAVTMNLRVAESIGPVGAYVAALSLISLAFGHFLVWVPYRRRAPASPAANGSSPRESGGGNGSFGSEKVDPGDRG